MESKVAISPVNMAERANLNLRAGDVVRVWQNIVEIKTQKQANKKEVATKNARKQAFEGTVLSVKHGAESGATFTVRKVSSGVGVEKIFPLYAPSIDSIEILRRTRTRRSKLYFIRRKAAYDVKRAMRRELAVTPRDSEHSAAQPAEEPVVETPQTEETAA